MCICESLLRGRMNAIYTYISCKMTLFIPFNTFQVMRTIFLSQVHRVHCRFFHTKTVKGMDLSQIITKLQKFAPLSLSESWDNVGLLLEPSAPHKVSIFISAFLLCEQVLISLIEVNTRTTMIHIFYSNYNMVYQQLWFSLCFFSRILFFISPKIIFSIV